MATVVGRTLALLRAPSNALLFQLRSRLAWSRGVATLCREPKAALFDWLDGAARRSAIAREQQQRSRYDLRDLHANSTRLCYAENLALLDGLERLLGQLELPRSVDGVLRAVDIGSGVFQYATALHRFLRHGGRGAPRRAVLRGIEVDGHGIYRDGHSRADHARAHAAMAGVDVHLHVADFTALRLPPQDMASLWYPFLSRYALLQWGLPLGMFRPRRLLARAVGTVRSGGLLVVANQTETEFARLQDLLAAQPVRLLRRVSLATDLVPYRERTGCRVGSVWERT